MRKTNLVAITAGALMLTGILGWVNLSNLPVEAKTSTGAQIDTFTIMSTAKNLPTEKFQDFSLVFCGE